MIRVSINRLSRWVIEYMVLAFSWWALHLWRQSEHLFDTERQLLEMRFSRSNQGLNVSQMQETAEYRGILREHQKRRRMVVSEGLFFVACLAFGLYAINRSAARELSMSRQRRNFLLSITHELKSPIAALRLVLDTIAKRDLQREQLSRLSTDGIKEAARLQQLVEDLLLAARLEDGWQPLPEPLDVRSVVEEVATRLRTRFPQADLRLHLPAQLPVVQADRPGFTAVVQNLLENAIKYSPEGSPVTVSAEGVGQRLRLRVSDEGAGIPDSEKVAVFDKFYRIGNEDTRHTTGTGLGLYIVQQVVQAHGGSIRVADHQPRGTVFEVEW